MSIAGVVKNGVVVPQAVLPEGAEVEIWIKVARADAAFTPLARAELRRLPREQRHSILAAAAERAEEDYRSDKDLTAFDAFSEEEFDDDESNSR